MLIVIRNYVNYREKSNPLKNPIVLAFLCSRVMKCSLFMNLHFIREGGHMADNDIQSVTALINGYLDAYNQGDIDSIQSSVANDSNLVAYGTDEGESWHGWEEFSHSRKRFFHAVEEVRWERGNPVIHFSQDGNVAWFSEELSGNFKVVGNKHKCPIRFTGVAEKRGESWRIVQLHRSVAVEGFSVPYLETHGVRFD